MSRAIQRKVRVTYDRHDYRRAWDAAVQRCWTELQSEITQPSDDDERCCLEEGHAQFDVVGIREGVAVCDLCWSSLHEIRWEEESRRVHLPELIGDDDYRKVVPKLNRMFAEEE